MNKQEVPEKHKKEAYKRWKQGKVTQKGYRDIVQTCQDRIGKDKTHLELYLVKGNKKGFDSCITNKRNPRENVDPLLNGTQDWMKKDMEKAKVLCVIFSSVFTSKTSSPCNQ